MKTIFANETGSLALGFQGETDRTQVVFDFADIWEEFPNGSIVLTIKRPGSEEVYPAIGLDIDYENHKATWIVKDYDVEFRGIGECQFIYTAGAIAKSKIWKTLVSRAMETTESEPPTWEDWKTELLQLGAEAAVLVERAERSAESAIEAAEEIAEKVIGVSDDADRAEAARDAAKDYRDESQHYAELAEQGADASGYVFFEVNLEDGNGYATISDKLSEEITLSIDENSGVLEVYLNE